MAQPQPAVTYDDYLVLHIDAPDLQQDRANPAKVVGKGDEEHDAHSCVVPHLAA